MGLSGVLRLPGSMAVLLISPTESAPETHQVPCLALGRSIHSDLPTGHRGLGFHPHFGDKHRFGATKSCLPSHATQDFRVEHRACIYFFSI